MLVGVPRRPRAQEDVTPITLRIPTALLERVRAIADREDRSVNAQLVRMIRELLQQTEPATRKR
jgi:hypothetical protein